MLAEEDSRSSRVAVPDHGAANRGAQEETACQSAGNIELPFEQGLNPYVERSINFATSSCGDHVRQVFDRVQVFPGDTRTMDELFEAPR